MSQIKSVICRILRSFRFLALFLIYLSNSRVCVIYDIVTLFIKGRYTTTTTTTATTTTTTNNNNNNDNNNNHNTNNNNNNNNTIINFKLIPNISQMFQSYFEYHYYYYYY